MNIRSAFLILSCVLFGATARSATVNWGATASPGGTGFVDSTGAALAIGNWLRIGFFTLSDPSVIALANPTQGNLATLDAAFKQFDFTTVGQGTSTAGIFQKASSVLLGSLDAAMPGHQIVIWALKGTPNNLSSVTEHAIFYEPSASNSSWLFPAGDLNNTTIDINQAKSSAGGVYLAGSYQASSPAIAGILGPGSGAVQLQGVPEPSTALLFTVGLVFMGSRRRRNPKGLPLHRSWRSET